MIICRPALLLRQQLVDFSSILKAWLKIHVNPSLFTLLFDVMCTEICLQFFSHSASTPKARNMRPTEFSKIELGLNASKKVTVHGKLSTKSNSSFGRYCVCPVQHVCTNICEKIYIFLCVTGRPQEWGFPADHCSNTHAWWSWKSSLAFG